MMTLFIITVKGCPEYKVVADDFIYMYNNDENFRQHLDERAKNEFKCEKFEFKIVAQGPLPLIASRHQDYFVSQN